MATGNETIALTSYIEQRNEEPNIKQVWERVLTTTYDADDAGVVTETLNINGVLRHVTVTLPATTTTGTTSQVLVKDTGGNIVFDTGELAENDTYNFSVDIPLAGASVSLEPSAASGDAVTNSTITLRGI